MSNFTSDFINTVQAYQVSDYAVESQYQRMSQRLDIWDRLNDIDDRRTCDILKFLNQWKCRLNYTCVSDLAQSLRESAESLSTFENHHLERISWHDLLNMSDIIGNVFERIASVNANRRTVGATATSKLLHLIHPQFFVMNDKKIRILWGCADNAAGYVNFMWRMKQFCRAVIQNYSTHRQIPPDQVFQNLVTECQSKATSLPKLLDEYNWVKASKASELVSLQ